MTTVPEMYVCARNRDTCYGVVKATTEFTADIRFDAASECSFTVPQWIYDVDAEKWVENPVYDRLVEDNLIYICDENEYFQYPVRQPGDSSFYKRNLVTDPTKARSATSHRLDMNKYLSGFAVHDETELFDIGADAGYTFNTLMQIENDGSVKSGDIVDYRYVLNDRNTYYRGESRIKYLTCTSFIPVSAGDVVTVNNRIDDGLQYNQSTGASFNGDPYRGYTWHVACYTQNDSSTYVGEYVNNSGMRAEGVLRIDITQLKDSNNIPLLPNGGYIRVWSDCGTAPSTYYTFTNTSSAWSYSYGYVYPIHGHVRVYSGERRCKYIDLQSLSGYNYPKLHWYTITNTSEEDDGLNRKKTVTILSYEYTLKNHTITLEEDTLSLYLPPPIHSLINGTDSTITYKWLQDCYTNSDSTVVYGPVMAQKTPWGVLNAVLAECPGWSLGNISRALMTTYRKVDAVDDVDVYSFLMNTVQELFHCFIVFDNDNRTISAYTLDDLSVTSIPSSRAVMLNWDNAVKSLTKENKATMSYTSLRIHTGDDTYGLGLVNPTGNSVIHNFYSISNELDFVPEGSTSGRTLRTAVSSWQSSYNNEWSSRVSSYNSYISSGTSMSNTTWGKFVQAHLDCIQADTARLQALSDYRVAADKINIYLRDDYMGDTSCLLESMLVGDKPQTPAMVKARSDTNCHSADLKQELWAAAYAYDQANKKYALAYCSMYGTDNAYAKLLTTAQKNACGNGYYATLKTNAARFTLDPNKKADNAILTQAERRALADYIKEGVWTEDTAIFSETYGVDDILSTLIGVYVNANIDLTRRLNQIQYDFTVDIANIAAIPEFAQLYKQLYLGKPIYLTISQKEQLQPIILERHINYKDPTDYSFTFTTDMRRRLVQFRFADLFGTIAQTSVTDNTFTFDE